MRPEVDKIYKHFKGNYYIVLEIAKETETGEEYVIYRRFSEDEETVWARPMSSWMASVVTADGEKPRFVEVDPVKEFGIVEEKNKSENAD